MQLTLKEPEIRIAITNYIAAVLGNNPVAINPDSIVITAGRGVNGLTAEVDVSLLKQPLTPASIPTAKPVAEVQEELPFEDTALEAAESLPEESFDEDDESDAKELEEAEAALDEAYEQEVATEAEAQTEEVVEEEPAPTPARRRSGSLFGKKKDAE